MNKPVVVTRGTLAVSATALGVVLAALSYLAIVAFNHSSDARRDIERDVARLDALERPLTRAELRVFFDQLLEAVAPDRRKAVRKALDRLERGRLRPTPTGQEEQPRRAAPRTPNGPKRERQPEAKPDPPAPTPDREPPARPPPTGRPTPPQTPSQPDPPAVSRSPLIDIPPLDLDGPDGPLPPLDLPPLL